LERQELFARLEIERKEREEARREAERKEREEVLAKQEAAAKLG